HTRFSRDWSSDVCSSDLGFELRDAGGPGVPVEGFGGIAARGQEGPEQADRRCRRGTFGLGCQDQVIVDDGAMPGTAQTDEPVLLVAHLDEDRKSTRLNSS